MGVDCSLLIKYKNGIKEIELDRFYVFDFVNANKWLNVQVLKNILLNHKLDEQRVSSLNNAMYRAHWLGYCMACLDYICDETTEKVAIVDEQQEIITRLYTLRTEQKLKKGSLIILPEQYTQL